MNKRSDWLLLIYGRFLVQISVGTPIILRFLVVFLCPSSRMLVYYLKFGHDRSFPIAIYHQAIILPFDAVHSELLRTSSSKPHRKK